MVTVISIVTNTEVVTTVVQLVHTVWMHMPAITTGLHAVGAALSVAAGVAALRRSSDHDR